MSKVSKLTVVKTKQIILLCHEDDVLDMVRQIPEKTTTYLRRFDEGEALLISTNPIELDDNTLDQLCQGITVDGIDFIPFI